MARSERSSVAGALGAVDGTKLLLVRGEGGVGEPGEFRDHCSVRRLHHISVVEELLICTIGVSAVGLVAAGLLECLRQTQYSLDWIR
jgi:hypothetical protein